MKLYWFRFAKPGYPVTMPVMPWPRRHYRWTGLYGVQIGPWFFGAVKGGLGSPHTPETPEDPTP